MKNILPSLCELYVCEVNFEGAVKVLTETKARAGAWLSCLHPITRVPELVSSL